MKALSLFANIGVAEAYLDDIGINVVLANEIDKKRAEVYKNIYPNCEMICGDITDDKIIDTLSKKAIELNIDIIMATPPCQGMSTAGKQNKFDIRNNLIYYAVQIIKNVKPRYVMLENVPMQLNTKIFYNREMILIPNYLISELNELYHFENSIINTANFGVPQIRNRAVFVLTRKDEGHIWALPKKEQYVKTLYDAIGHLPPLDPLIYDIDYNEHLKIFPNYEKNKRLALSISKWHIPPCHIYRQVKVMLSTPTGQSAFNNSNPNNRPKNKNGDLVKGYKNTYKRQSWDMPAYTITMYNRTISSQNNVHPGRPLEIDKNGEILYSDPRVLTIYELMLAMSLPTNWNIPNNVSEHFIRSVIGEGIPPLFIKKLFSQII